MTYFQYTAEEAEQLKARCDALSPYIERFGMIKREIIPDFFTALANSIVSQQISTKAAETVWNKLTALLPSFTAEAFLAANQQQLRDCGLPFRKIERLCSAAEKIMNDELNPDRLRRQTDDEAVKTLCSLSGVGVWTAEMLLIFCFERKNVLSRGDFGIKKAIKTIYRLERTPTEADFKRFYDECSPLCSIASFYLWQLNKQIL